MEVEQFLELDLAMATVAQSEHIVVALLAVAYWGLLMPTVISVSIWLPVSSG